MSSLPVDGYSWLMGHLDAQIHLVKLEVRPVAQMTFHRGFPEHLRDALETVEKEGLLHLTIEGKSDIDLFIFKRPHLAEVIRQCNRQVADWETCVKWIEGKMFGYSEAEIGQYIEATAEIKA